MKTDGEKRSTPLVKVYFCGYFPGVIGRITELHAVYYHENWGFDVTFETQVGKELSEFIRDFKAGRDCFWVATVGGRLAGSIAVDGLKGDREGARLRWFIVDPEFQGAGIGRKLLSLAVGFCRGKPYPRLYLWTFRGLDTARFLYEKAGFHLGEEHDVFQWGRNITEQKFEILF